MQTKYILIFLLFLSALQLGKSQNITGKVIDVYYEPVAKIEVKLSNGISTETNKKGQFSLEKNGEKNLILTINDDDYKPFRLELNDKKNVEVLLQEAFLVDEVVFQKKKNNDIQSLEITPSNLDKLPSLTGGVENILTTLPYVSSYNELSSQYQVRGGNYDENLVYVNGFEIYRPQLIRSGQQEALSFLNPNMVQNIHFSAGGFQSKYGDKMSSVLDIAYKKPQDFEAELELSAVGGSATVGFSDKYNTFNSLTGVRYRDTRLVINTKDTEANVQPINFDIQSFWNYKINSDLNLNFLGSFNKNNFLFEPELRETTFGTVGDIQKLTVAYQGQEKDAFQTALGALSLEYEPSRNLNISLNGSVTHTKEQEYFDILGYYRLADIDQNGEETFSRELASQLTHARNNLDALITNVELKGRYKFNNNNADIQWGLKYQNEDIKDRIEEWEFLEAQGYSIPNFDITPGDYQTTDLPIYGFVQSQSNLNTNRYSAYMQLGNKFETKSQTKYYYNVGLRSQYWGFNKEFIVSPRAQIAIKPNWGKDMLFRFATGLYAQAPFYKEIRDLEGSIHNDVKAQKSFHITASNDYSFEMYERPFKLTSELYYKKLTDVNPYYIDNVRIKYTANNNAEGFVYGADFRLNGEFIPGAESWFSAGYVVAKENIDNRGNISRPTDSRLKIGVFFQDYMPKFPSFKVYVNGVYNTGLPVGAPFGTDPYEFTSRLGSYKRVDIGFTKIFVDQNKFKAKTDAFWANFKELSLSIEAFNLLNIRNTISNQYVRDAYTSRLYGVPNYLSGRFFNLKLNMKF